MQKLSDVLKHTQHSQAETSGVTTHNRPATSSTYGALESGKSPIEQIISRLTFIYGARFIEQFDVSQAAAMKLEWWKAIEQFTPGAIAGALERCHIQHKTWPPTLGEFVALCKAQQPPNYLKLAAPREPAPAGIFDELRRKVKRSA
jgi:hypothetical protein